VGSLTFRGSGAGPDRFLDDLAPAFEAYRAGQFAVSAERFAVLAAKYPKTVEPAFYLGVSRLLSGEPTGAVDGLERAASMKDEVFAEDIAWYLAVALHRAGRAEEARAQLTSVCGGKGAHATGACDALAKIERSATATPQ
jgi:hypothetical protein